MAKHITVLTSRVRKVCVFSYKGEWENDITKYSPSRKAEMKMKLTNYKILTNIGCTVSEIASNSNAIISLGFTEDGLMYLEKIIKEGYHLFKNDPIKLKKILEDLPTTKDELSNFNTKYNFDLPMPVNYSTKQNIVNRYYHCYEWFYNPYDGKETKNHYNFKQEFLKINHLIIDLSLGHGHTDKNRAMALCGYVLSQLREINFITKPLYVFEEVKELLPPMDNYPDALLPSSIVEIYALMTLDPKTGCALMMIMQSENMIFRKCLEQYYIKIIGIGSASSYIGAHPEYEVLRRLKLKWNPDMNYRELLYWEKTNRYFKFVPLHACCRC